MGENKSGKHKHKQIEEIMVLLTQKVLFVFCFVLKCYLDLFFFCPIPIKKEGAGKKMFMNIKPKNKQSS